MGGGTGTGGRSKDSPSSELDRAVWAVEYLMVDENSLDTYEGRQAVKRLLAAVKRRHPEIKGLKP